MTKMMDKMEVSTTGPAPPTQVSLGGLVKIERFEKTNKF